ncbi:MAG: transglycosylase family protein [bacterium]
MPIPNTCDSAMPPPERVPLRSRRRTRALLAGLTLALGATTVTLVGFSPAAADPSATDWYRLRQCESGNNYAINTGNGYYGAYQFDLATWRSVGGTGYPNRASSGEQDARALILYRMRGWQPWTCAGIVGLREDADARSGRTSDIRVPTSAPAPAPQPAPTPAPASTGAPAWPNTQYWSLGDASSTIRHWQVQMRARGATLPTDGRFGAATLTVVNRIQRFNGLPATGLLGPVTWRLAWTGRYARPIGAVATAPAWPGPVYWSAGTTSPVIKRWQFQMIRRGAAVSATGRFDASTLAVVNRIQRLNGLPATGLLGPVTWGLAWTGSY